MKILHVIPSIDARYGGPSYAVRAMVRFQNEAGLRADVATTYATQDTRHKAPAKLTEGKQDAGGSGKEGQVFSFPSCFGEYKFSFGLWRWLQKNINSYDIVHIHSIFCFSTAMTAMIARKARIPTIVRPLGQLYPWALKNRSCLIKKAYLALIENKTIHGAVALHFTAQDELDQCGVKTDKSKAYVLPLGVEQQQEISRLTALTFYPELKDKKVLLFLSRIHPKKGLDLVLPWLAPLILKRPDWVFVIAGEAERMDYLERLKQFIQQYGIKNRVVFAGHVSGDKKTALLTLADSFILPSHSENFGIAVVEAMAAGVPVLVSDQVGVHDEISHHQAGLVFRLEQGSLSAVVGQMMADERLRKIASHNAKKLVREKFDWQAITDRQITYYEEILNRSFPPADGPAKSL